MADEWTFAVAERVVIIGAGLSGLRVANRLYHATKIIPIVLESSTRCGGRLCSVHDDAGAYEFDVGGWTIGASHSRAIELCAHAGVPLVTVPRARHRGSMGGEDVVRGLSEWDVKAFHCRNPMTADHRDLASGLADATAAAASGTLPRDDDDDDAYSAPRTGFGPLVRHLAKVAHVIHSTRVVDVRRLPCGEYVIQCRCSDGRGGAFVNRTYTCAAVFIAVPPERAERWTVIGQWARAQLHSVTSVPMHCVHAHASAPTRFHLKSAQSLLGQSVSSLHDGDGTGWFQPSRTTGRLATFWNNLRMTSPAQFMHVLLREVKTLLHLTVDAATVRAYFFEHGMHVWRPNAHFSKPRAVEMSVAPNVAHLPNVYWVGDAFSSHQGWIEGALETADLAADVFLGLRPHALTRRELQTGEVAVEGRIVRAASFDHPGGAEVLAQADGRSANDAFYHQMHSKHAWSMVYSLQQGFT